MRWSREALTFATCAAVMVMLGLTLVAARETRSGVRALALELKEKTMTTMTSEWQSGGIKRTLTTVKRDNESPAQHATRHQDEVAAMVAVFPVDP